MIRSILNHNNLSLNNDGNAILAIEMATSEKNTLHYFNISGFNIVFLTDQSPYTIDKLSDDIISNWKFLLLARKIISYPIVFKTITDHCRDGIWFSRIYFYEIRDRPISMIIKVLDPKTIFIFDSNPQPYRLIRRVIANPRYSNSVVLLVKLPYEEPRPLLEKVQNLTRIARKLYLELSPLTFNRELGRLMALKLRQTGGEMEIVLCVNKEGVSTRFSHGGLVINIISLEKCLSSGQG